MTKPLDLQEVAIVLQAANLDPAILNPSLFNYGAVFPTDWETVRQPLCQRNTIQIVFKNGISLMVHPNRVVLSELVFGKELHELQVAALMDKWIAALPNIDYRALGVNPTGMVSFPEDQQGAANFFKSTLLTERVRFDGTPALAKASLNLAYQLEHGMLNLSIQEGVAQLPENQSISALLYSGNCHYPLQGESRVDRLNHLKEVLGQWKTGVETYRDLVTHKLLQSAELVSV
ncbi:MAG: hypothetical protein AAFR31_16250 [Cyanobacteria bacterium J06627_8]